jgi:hypothetical protein
MGLWLKQRTPWWSNSGDEHTTCQSIFLMHELGARPGLIPARFSLKIKLDK